MRWAAPTIAALVVAAYFNALGGAFHFDDSHAIENNPAIRSLANVPRFFTDATTFSVLPQNHNYRPLLLTTYAATAQLTGVRPKPFLAVNLAVHALCALLVLALVTRIARALAMADADWVGFGAAALFAVHPIFSECVNYVSARSDSLCACLSLASLLFYLRAREQPKWLAAAVLAMVAAGLVKPVAAIVPPLALILDLGLDAGRAPRKPFVVRQAVMWLSAILAAAFTIHMTPKLAIQSASSYTRLEYFRSELPALWHYVRLFVWPVGQSADPDYPVARSFLEPRVVISAVAIALTVIASSVALFTKAGVRGWAMAALWFFIALAPSSSLAPLAEIVNEHRPYLAAIALCAATSALLLIVSRKLGHAPALAVGVLILAAGEAATVQRNLAWASEETLWRDVAEKAPQSARAQMNYGLALMQRSAFTEAEPRLREAVRLAPNYAYARINLGNLLLATGRPEPARAELDRAVSLAPDLFYAPFYRGLAGERLGDPPVKLVELFGAAARLSPSFADAHYHLAIAQNAAGDLTAALASAEKAVALRGSYEDRFELAYQRLLARDLERAERDFSALLTERPSDPRAAQNLRAARAARASLNSAR